MKKNEPIPENVDCIETENMLIKRVQTVQFLGLLVDENCIGMLMLIMCVCPWLNFSKSSIM